MAIALYIIGSIVILFLSYSVYSFFKIKRLPVTPDSNKIKVLNNNNFGSVTKKGIVLVDFWAPWCAPCKMMAPVLNEIAESESSRITIAKVNVDNQQQLAGQFMVRSIPTLIFMKNGKEVKRYIGFKPKSVILNEIDRLL